jgi:1,4-alpha-glucan branching enzyme
VFLMISVDYGQLKSRRIVATKPQRTAKVSDSNVQTLPSKSVLPGYYTPNFGHKLPVHLQQGVTFVVDKNTSVRKAVVNMFTHKDVEKVELQIAKKGVLDDLLLTNYKNAVDEDKLVKIPLESRGMGYFRAQDIAEDKLTPGDQYRFKITRKDGDHFITDLYAKEFLNPFDDNTKISDEARSALKKDSLVSWPVAYDDNKYKFSQEHIDWMNGAHKERISRTDADLTPPSAMRIMQIHIGTLPKGSTPTKETLGNNEAAYHSNFKSAIEFLDKVKDTGCNTVEILPHGYFHKTNWGYDPSFPFASQYGGNDAFKEFCDAAHQKKLNVVVDLVTNHYSMDHANILGEAGPYDAHNNYGFGPRINYKGEGKEGVRDWRVNESLYWLNNGADGIRYDLTGFTESPEFLTQMSHEVKYHYPNAVMIAEDDHDYVVNKMHPHLTEKIDDTRHEELINYIQNDGYTKNGEGCGFDSRWHFDTSHSVEKAVLMPFSRDLNGLADHLLGGYWKNQDGKSYQAQGGQLHVKTFLSHDEIAKQEADGNDFVVKKVISQLFGQDYYNPSSGNDEMKKKNWAASRKVRALTEIFETGKPWPTKEKQFAPEISAKGGKNIDDYKDEKYGIADYEAGGFGLDKEITKEEFGAALETAKAGTKAAMSLVFSTPGPKMIFQTYNKPTQRFAFFRENTEHFYQNYLPNKEVNIKGRDWEDIDKGHRVDAPEIIKESTLDTDIKLTPEAQKYHDGMEKLVQKLNEINQNNRALQDGYITSKPIVHDNLIAVHSKSDKDNSEIFAVTSFDEANDYKGNYWLTFPKGKWQEVLNSDAEEFGGRGLEFSNKNVIDSTQNQNQNISVPRSSTMIFKRVDAEPVKKTPDVPVVKPEEPSSTGAAPNPQKSEANDTKHDEPKGSSNNYDNAKSDDSKSNKKGKVWPWIVGGTAVGIGGYLFAKKQNKDKNQYKPLNKMA